MHSRSCIRAQTITSYIGPGFTSAIQMFQDGYQNVDSSGTMFNVSRTGEHRGVCLPYKYVRARQNNRRVAYISTMAYCSTVPDMYVASSQTLVVEAPGKLPNQR